MKKFMKPFVVCLFVLALGVSRAPAQQADIVEKLEHGEINWTKMTVRAQGEGAPNPKHINPAQARLGAERAAKVDALRRLLEITKGLRVNSESTMRDYVLVNDKIRMTVEGIVKGAQQVDIQYREDRVLVTMEMPITGDMIAVLYQQASKKLQRPPSGMAVDEFDSRLPPGARQDAYQRNLDRLRKESSEYQARKAQEEADARAREQAAAEAQRQAEEKARLAQAEADRLKAEADKARADAEVQAKAETERKAAELKAKQAEYDLEQQRLKAEEEQRKAAEAEQQKQLLEKDLKEKAAEEERRQAEIKRLEEEKLKAPPPAPAAPAAPLIPAAAPASEPATTAVAAAGGAVAGAAVAEFAISASTVEQKPVDPAAEIQWSGLVVDARGLGLKPALVPRIYTKTGDDLYTAQTVQVDNATKSGLVGYARDVNAAAKHIRVASDPVLVKGVQAAGNGKSDLVLTDGDAKIIQQTDQKSPYLRNARVMVVFN